MKRICVYSGSNSGNKEAYKKAAIDLAKVFLENDIELVYGGSKFGLMGIIADYMVQNGGTVIGIMPRGLFPDGVVHQGIAEFIQVEDMSARKKKMIEISDGFVALPGGVGTYEEFFETLSGAQLKLHKKPLALYNVEGYYEHLIQLLQNTMEEGFMNASNLDLIIASSDADDLYNKMCAYEVPDLGIKWKDLK